MNNITYDSFFEALSECSGKVDRYLFQERFTDAFKPADLREAILAYPKRSGKRLRPAVLMWSCGAAGGDPDSAIPAAAAVELFHNWTLVHDDIIDNDDTRRGGPTVHKIGQKFARITLGYPPEDSVKYGTDIAILAGDLLHSWSVACVTELISSKKVAPEVALAVLKEMETGVVNTLIEGETLDMQFSGRPIETLSPEDILLMLWAKTGALYAFSARAGAMIGLGSTDTEHPVAMRLAEFASECGIAFQLQDDILGTIGDERQLGKPVGSDLREGKKTMVIYYALQELEGVQRDFLLGVMGNPNADESDVTRATQLIVESGAVDKTGQLARKHIENSFRQLEALEDSPYRNLLKTWADYMVNRKL